MFTPWNAWLSGTPLATCQSIWSSGDGTFTQQHGLSRLHCNCVPLNLRPISILKNRIINSYHN